MSVLLTNNAEDGTNGVDVDYYNSGETSGAAWTYISIGTGASIKFSNVQKRGTMAYSFATGATATQAFSEWNILPELSTMYVRFAIYLPVIPASSIRPLEIHDGVNVCASFGIRSDGKMSIRDGVAAQVAVSAIPLPVGRWLRIEAKIVSSATVGQVTYRLYTEVDSPYPAENLVSAAAFNTRPGSNDPSGVRFGLVGFNVTNTQYYLDDMAVTDVDYLGPANASQLASLLYANNAEMNSNGTVATLANTGDAQNNYFSHILGAGSISFSSAQQSHGALSYLFQPVSGSESRFTWRTLATPSAALRVYVYWTGYPPFGTEFAHFATTDTGPFTQPARLVITTGGNLRVIDNTGLTLWNSAAPMALNTWYRVEMLATLGGSPTTGTIQAAYYALDNLTAIDSFTTSTADLGSMNFSWARFGKLNAGTWTDPFYMDNMAVQQAASGFIGVYTGPPTPPASFAGIIPHLGWGREV